MSVTAQQTDKPPFAEPPKLEPAFEDDFENDTRDDYLIEGDVKWEEGNLTLNADAVLGRQLNAGSWVELELDLQFPKLVEDGKEAEFRIWLDLEGATDCYLSFLQKKSSGSVTSTISIFDTDGEFDENDNSSLIKQVNFSKPLENGMWRIKYRYGLFEISSNSSFRFNGFIENTAALVSRLAFVNETNDHVFQLSNLKVSCSMNADFRPEPEVVNQLRQAAVESSQVVQKWKAGQYPDAIPVAKKVVETREEILGSYHHETVMSLFNLAAQYKGTQEFEKALNLFKKAEESMGKIVGTNHPGYARCLNDQALLLVDKGEYQQARPVCENMVRIMIQVFGKNHLRYSNGLNVLARLDMAEGKYDEAKTGFTEVVRIRGELRGRRSQQYAASLQNLAILNSSMGSYREARKMMTEVLDIYSSVMDRRHPHFSPLLNNLASIHVKFGAYDLAEPLLQEAVKNAESSFGKVSPGYALNVTNLASLYYHMGEYDRAEALYLEAQKIRERVFGENSEGYAMGLHNLAVLKQARGATESSRKLFEQSLEILKTTIGPGHPRHTQGLRNLAFLCTEMNDYKQAGELLDEARVATEMSLGRDHPDYATIIHAIGKLQQKTGSFDSALESLSRAVQIWNNAFGDKHPYSAEILGDLAAVHIELGSFKEAAALYQKSLDICQSNFEQFSAIQTEAQQRDYQNRFQRTLDDYLTASILSHDYLDVFERILNWNGNIQLRQQEIRKLESHADLNEYFEQLRSLSEQLYVHLEKDPSSPNWEKRFEKLSSEREQTEAQLASESATYRKLNKQVTLEEVRNALPENTSLVCYVNYRHSTTEENGTVDESRLVAFIVNADHRIMAVQLGDATSIAQSIKDFRNLFSSESITQNLVNRYETAATLLRKRIWEPIESEVAGKSRILICPAGELGTLPFTALPGKDANTYLANEYTIATVAVPKLLPEMVSSESDADEPGMLLIGDVNYKDAKEETDELSKDIASNRQGQDEIFGGEWPELTETGPEVDAIATLFRAHSKPTSESVLVIKRNEATEYSFAKAAPSFGYLHLATHGFFAPKKYETVNTAELDTGQFSASERIRHARFYKLYQSGMLSGLVFAGANKKEIGPGSNDGIMTADEISFLPLHNVDLVTLSACETGLGKAAGGEGLIGIQRAFQVSGARTTIASLWKVDDLATRKLMERFYTNLLEKKMSKLDALNEAQRWLMNNPAEHSDITRGKRKLTTHLLDNSKTLHPHYWGAWVLSGDWR